MKNQFKIICLILFLGITANVSAQTEYNEEYQVLKINALLKEVAKNYNNNVTNKIRIKNGILYYDKSKPGSYTTTTSVGLNRLDPKHIKLNKGMSIGFKTLKNKKFVRVSAFPDLRRKGFSIMMENKDNKDRHQELVALFKELVEVFQKKEI